MADVFGFNARDAEDLIAGIGGGDRTERLNFGGGGGANLFRFELTADFTTGNAVAATIKTMGGSTVGTGISLTDPELIFFGLLTGSKGYCLLQSGVYYPIQAACNDEEGYL